MSGLALPVSRRLYMSSNRHHRRPRSQGGTRHKPKGNCVRVDSRLHYYWHCIFGNMTGDRVAHELNTKWLDPAFKVIHK